MPPLILRSQRATTKYVVTQPSRLAANEVTGRNNLRAPWLRLHTKTLKPKAGWISSPAPNIIKEYGLKYRGLHIMI